MIQAIIDSKELAEALSFWAATSGIVAALAAGTYAYWRYRKDREYHEWDRAREAFSNFNKLAMEKRQFYPRCWSQMKGDDTELKNEFEWYAAAMLWACEEIYASTKGKDQAWIGTIRILIRDHLDYFSSPEFQEDLDGYDEEIKAIVRDECQAEESSATRPGAPPRSKT